MQRVLVRAGLVALAALAWAAAAPWPAPVEAASWSWPVTGVVTRPFAPPVHRWGAGHRGVDLLSVPGAPVRAAGAGRVSYAGLLAGRGVLVVVHGALRTTYEPVSASVGLGEVVAEGEVIGTLGAGHAGCPVLACLHWGLRRGEDYLDPLRLVDPGPVRLLPPGGGPAAAGSSAGVLRDGGGSAVRGAGTLGPAGPPVGAVRTDTGAATVPALPGAGPAAGGPAPPPTGGGVQHAAALTGLGAVTLLVGAVLRRRS